MFFNLMSFRHSRLHCVAHANKIKLTYVVVFVIIDITPSNIRNHKKWRGSRIDYARTFVCVSETVYWEEWYNNKFIGYWFEA